MGELEHASRHQYVGAQTRASFNICLDGIFFSSPAVLSARSGRFADKHVYIAEM